MECNDAAQKLTLVIESEAERNTKEPGQTRRTGIFITRRHWEKDNRVRKAKSFKRVGRAELVEVGPKQLTPAEKARYGPLVYRPYLKQRRERFKNREVKPVMLCVRPYMTSIFPVCEGPRRSEKKLETKRGRIKGFTRKSRARQIRKIMGLEVLPDIFSSLTYDDTVIEKLCDLSENRDRSSAEIMDEKIHADIHRMSSYIRKKFPGVWFCWRVEWEARKWGRFKGLIVPHWHGLWGGPVPFEVLRQIVLKKWLDYTGTKNPDALVVTHRAKSFIKLNGKRNIFYYVSKYTAKESRAMGFETGRHWGIVGPAPMAQGMVIEVDAWESRHLIRQIRRWMDSKKAKGGRYIKKTVLKGTNAYVYIEDIDLSTLLELAADLGEIPF